MYRTFDFTPVCDTNIFASGDVIADNAKIYNIFPSPGHSMALISLSLIDKDDQGVAMDVYLTQATGVMGTVNAAPSVSDANAALFMARIPVATADWTDLGGARVANLKNLWTIVTPTSGTCDIYCSIVNGTGTPTFTASGLVLRFGFQYERA